MRKAKAALTVFCALVLLYSSLQTALAQTNHLVTTSDFHQAIVKQSSTRRASLDSLERLFSKPEVARTVERTIGSPEKIVNAVAVLSDAELARLAESARDIERDFAAGALSNQELTYIVIALGTAVLILVIVVAGD